MPDEKLLNGVVYHSADVVLVEIVSAEMPVYEYGEIGD